MTPTAIDRLIRAQAPLQLHAQRIDASSALLRADLESLGIDTDALAAALGSDPAPLPLIDAGPAECGLCAENHDKLRAAERVVDTLRAEASNYRECFHRAGRGRDHWEARAHRLAAIARRIREQRDTYADRVEEAVR